MVSGTRSQSPAIELRSRVTPHPPTWDSLCVRQCSEPVGAWLNSGLHPGNHVPTFNGSEEELVLRRTGETLTAQAARSWVVRFTNSHSSQPIPGLSRWGNCPQINASHGTMFDTIDMTWLGPSNSCNFPAPSAINRLNWPTDGRQIHEFHGVSQIALAIDQPCASSGITSSSTGRSAWRLAARVINTSCASFELCGGLGVTGPFFFVGMAAARKASRSCTKALICCSNSATQLGGKTGGGACDCCSNRLNRARPSSNVVFSATTSASNFATRCSARLINFRHSLIWTSKGRSRAASRAFASTLCKQSTSAPEESPIASKAFSNLVTFNFASSMATSGLVDTRGLGFICALTRVNAASSSALAPLSSGPNDDKTASRLCNLFGVFGVLGAPFRQRPFNSGLTIVVCFCTRGHCSAGGRFPRRILIHPSDDSNALQLLRTS